MIVILRLTLKKRYHTIKMVYFVFVLVLIVGLLIFKTCSEIRSRLGISVSQIIGSYVLQCNLWLLGDHVIPEATIVANCIILKYKYQGSVYQLVVPRNSDVPFSEPVKISYSVRGRNHSITSSHSLPLLVKPRDLRCTKVNVTYREQTKTFTGEQDMNLIFTP